MLDAADVPLLRAVLRARRADPARLSRTLRLPRAEVMAGLDRLTASGYLIETEAGLGPRPPHEVLLADARETLTERAAALESLTRELDELPGLLRDWHWGEPSDETRLAAEVLHGPTAIIEAWWRYVDRTRPVATINVCPDARAFALVPDDDAARLIEYVGPNAGGIRIIVGADSLDDPVARTAVDGLLEIGLQIRTLSDPPGWFFADGDVAAALPTDWGDPWPTSVLLVRNPVIPAALTRYFELLWARATPVGFTEDGWEPILRLLDEGLTDDEVAERLALSPRTVRRRITEAMDEYGVSNRFTLGRAWGRLEV